MKFVFDIPPTLSDTGYKLLEQGRDENQLNYFMQRLASLTIDDYGILLRYLIINLQLR